MPTSTSWRKRRTAAPVLGEDRRAVAEAAAVDHGDRVVERVDPDDREHGPEDLLTRDVHLRRDVVEDRRADEGAAGLARRRRARRRRASRRRRTPRSIQPRMRSRAAPETTGPTSLALVSPSPTRSASVASRSGGISAVVGLAHGRRRPSRPCSAGPAAPKAEPMMPVDRLVDHGVRHDHHVVLGPAERLHALAGLGRALVDEPRHRGRADERDGVDARVVEDPLHHLAAAVDEVHHAAAAGRARRGPRTRSAGSAAPARTA